MNQKACKTCAAYCVSVANARHGYCRARSPQAIMTGTQHHPVVTGLGSTLAGRTIPSPIVKGFFPPVAENCWCLDWRESDIGPVVEAMVEAMGDSAPMGEAA